MVARRPRKVLRSLPLFALFLASAQAAPAQPAARVMDLNTTQEQETFYAFFFEPFATLDGALYYTSDDGVHGVELWKTDGTAAGSVLVKDICPGACGSMPRGLTVAGDRLLFFAQDSEHGRELWTTDGTPGGTSLVADIYPGRAGGSGGIVGWTVEVGGTVYFEGQDPTHGAELWKSDGTPAGTVLVADIWPGPGHSVPSVRVASGGTLLFEANDGTHGIEPWLTDGTAAGTRLLKDIRPGAENSMGLGDTEGFLATASGLFFFAANDGMAGWELWVSDGTEAGTVLTLDIDPGPGSGFLPNPLLELAGVVYFMGSTPDHGYELWRSDGTAAGTWLVQDIRPGTHGSAPDDLVVFSGALYFRAWGEAAGMGLYTSDGTADGTVRITDTGTATGFTVLGGQLLFFVGPPGNSPSLWKSDGTAAGTLLVSDFGGQAVPTLPFYSPGALVAGDLLYFRAFDLDGEVDLWASDGTAAGTVLVAETSSPTSSILVSPWDGRVLEPSSWGVLGDRLIWLADDGMTGNEPWATDGTADGTQQLAETLSGPDWSSFRGFTPLAGGDRALFSTGLLWETDGTPDGTEPLFPAGGPSEVSEPTRLGSTVFFSGSSAAAGDELWKTDGTAAGTVQVADLRPGTAGSIPFRLTAVGSTLFFVASSTSGPGGPDQELWKSDGTAGGTVLVEDIRPGAESSQIDHLTPVAGRLFFAADDGTSGQEPWVSDGTADGTFRLKDIAPGAEPSLPPYPATPTEGLAAAVGSTFFFQAGAGTDKELWASDGTEAGTRRVKDIRPGPGGSEPRWLTAAGGRLFFSADDGTHGHELWVSDGTEAGTVPVGDLLPGAGSSLPRELAAVGNAVIFSATDGAGGVEAWASDGTWLRPLGDLAPGSLPSSPTRFTPAGDQVYFAAHDGTTGFELWSIPRSALAGPLDFYTVTPCRVADTRATTPLLTNQPRTVQAVGSCGIPAEARAVAVNFTAVAPNGHGFLVAWPTGAAKPPTASLNYNPGVTRSNNAVVELGTDGKIDVQGQTVIENGRVHLVVDVVGYFR